MEKKFKRLSLALLALGLSAPAFAENCVRVPSQQGGFKVGIDALYLRPTVNDLNYATVVAFPSNFPVGLQHNAIVDPSFDWGFYAQVGYLFPCTGNDLTVGYTYLRTDETNSVDVGTATAGIGPVISLLPVGANSIFGPGVNFAAAEGKSELDLNAIDLEAGQRFTRCAYDMRMFAGVRYANIDHTLSAVGRPFADDSEGDNTTITGVQQFKTEYRGIGPRLGVDGRYCLNSGFGIDGNLSTSLLVGTVDSRYRAARISADGLPVPVEAFQAKDGSRTRIVPVLEAKLGVDYTHIIDCRCKSSIVFEAGYQVTNYFNAVDHARVVTGLPPAVAPAQPSAPGAGLISQNTSSDVSFDGPYFGVKYYA